MAFMDEQPHSPGSSAYADAAVELLKIISNSEQEVLDRIPAAFIEKLKAAAEKSTHSFTLIRTKPLSGQHLLPETKKALVMIYENYLSDGDDRIEERNAQAAELRKSKLAQYQALAAEEED